jgi:outer membrane protein assembly factor BamA
MYTLNQQTLLNVNFNLFPNTRWRFNGSFGYNVYPYFYAGTGNTHNGEYLEWYDATYPFVHVSAFRRIKKSAFWMVGKIDFQYTEITQLKEPGLLATTRPLGYNGSTQLQPQLGVLFNTRDYESSATKGWYALVSAGGNLTGYTNTVCQIDVRKYFNLTPKNDVLALQAYGTFNNQEVPFNLLAQLGGSNLMRGYRQGVYRDQQMVVYQMELRTRLFWKLLSFSAFGNMGVVGANWEDMQAHYRYTYGAGVRVAVDAKKRQFVRIDYGASEQFQGVYFAIGEAF